MRSTTAEIAQQLSLLGTPSSRFSDFNEMHKALVFFQKTHFDQYVPTLGSSNLDYGSRLESWLHNVASDEQRALLMELATRIVFLSREDISKLHEAAMRGPIARWMVDTCGISLSAPDLNGILADEMENHTWYTSITDSMQISEFHHVNHIGGTDFRPDWKSLAQFGDPGKICLYMQQHVSNGRYNPLRRIVILEDFIGTGTQMTMGSGSVSFAASRFPNTPILLCPLLCCPVGASAARDLASRHPNLTFEPVLEIEQKDLLSNTSHYNATSFEGQLSQFCIDSYSVVAGHNDPYTRPYSPLGFADTGAMVVMYTNAPANTLPIVQHQSSSWNALFPRSARIR